MRVGTQEHYEIMAMFEKEFKGERMDREVKNMWPKGYIYQNGETNRLFFAYLKGVALGKVLK